MSGANPAEPHATFAQVASISLDTRSLPVAEQFEGWARHTPSTQLSPLRAGPFSAWATMWDLGSVQLSESHLDPFVSDRSEAMISAVESNYVQVVLIRDGRVIFETDNGEDTIGPGEIFVRDYARASVATALEPIHSVVLYCARERLATPLRTVDFRGKLPAGPEVSLLQSAMTQLVAQMPFLTANATDHYADALCALAIAALERAGCGNGAVPIDHELLERVRRYIVAQPMGSVSPTSICAALGVSRSALYRLFAATGGVVAWDRRRRLRLLYRALADTRVQTPVNKLAEAHGFRDPVALRRAFRKAFGCSPGAVGRRTIDASPPSEQKVARVRGIIERLG